MIRRMDTRVWICKKCNKRGFVKFWPNSGASKILDKIKESHKEMSPNCELSVETLKIIYPGSLSIRELAEVASIPTRKRRFR